MSDIEKLLVADDASTEIRIRRLELLWEMNTTTNPITDEENRN